MYSKKIHLQGIKEASEIHNTLNMIVDVYFSLKEIQGKKYSKRSNKKHYFTDN
jgi:hypothetical protein